MNLRNAIKNSFINRNPTRARKPLAVPAGERARHGIEPLEARIAPAKILGVLSTTNSIVSFDSATPGTIDNIVTVTGLFGVAEKLVAIEFRPATGQLFGLGINDPAGAGNSEGRVYIINPTTGVATQVGAAPFLSNLTDGANYGFDFNPTVDRIRVVNDVDLNARVNPNDGTLVAVDTAINPSTADIVGSGYDRTGGGSEFTTLFGIDFTNKTLVRQGGVDGTPSPNLGAVTTIGSLGVAFTDRNAGFDIEAGTGTAFAALRTGTNTQLFTINLGTGAATLVSTIGNGSVAPISGIAVVTSAIVVAGTAGTDTLVVTATGANSGSYSLNGGAAVNFAGITAFTFDAGAGNDTFTITNPAASLFGPVAGVFYNGQTQASTPGDTLILQGGGGANFTETYTPSSANNGRIVTSGGGVTQTLTFTGLEPVTDTVVADSYDLILPIGADTVNVVNGPIASGFQTLQVNGGAAPTFESVNFANKTNVRVMGNSGADTFTINYTLAAAGLATFELDGHIATGVLGQPVDDNATDRFDIRATAALVGGGLLTLNGNGGTDLFQNIGYLGVGTFNLDAVNGPINIIGGGGAADTIALSDRDSAGPDGGLTITSTSITNYAPAAITYSQIGTLYVQSTSQNDSIDVLSTNAGTRTIVASDGGLDTITVGNTSGNFAPLPLFTGDLKNIQGAVIILADDSSGSLGTADTVNVDASGNAALAGTADITNVGVVTTNFANFGTGVFGFQGSTTRLTNFAPATIEYIHGDLAASPAGAFYGGLPVASRLEFLNVRASTGNDIINVNDTTATNTTTLDAREGNDTVTIKGTTLSANNIFQGFDGNDQFILNIPGVGNSIGTGAAFPIASLQIQGNNASDTVNRDRLTINDSGNVGRRIDYLFLNSQGDLNVATNPAFPNSGLFGPNVPNGVVTVRTMETYIFNDDLGEGGVNNDLVRIFGGTDNGVIGGTNPSNDVLTVGLLANNTSAFVFRNGSPYLETPPVTVANSRPGLAGGGTSTDLLLRGLSAGFGITLDGNGIPAAGGDRAVVYAASEDSLTDVGNPTNVFGFGAGVLIPGFGAGLAYDTINVTDAQVTTTNNIFGALTTVHLATASFVQGVAHVSTERPALVVNGGDEAGVQASHIADDITATISNNFNIQINGNLPGLTFSPAGDPTGIREGDQLTILSPSGALNVFSDASAPPNVTVTSTTSGVFGIRNSSIERLTLDAAPNGIVNIIGDNNDPNVTQNDYFKVRGRDIDGDGDGNNEFSLQIGGNWNPATGAADLSAPIFFNNATRINVSGGNSTGFDTKGNAIPQTVGTGVDVLDITAYADNTPRGWGIETYFNEGDPGSDGGTPNPDLLIFNAVSGVSENIVINPSAPEGGQVFSNNAATNTPIAVVNYVLNTNIIINGNNGAAGDTDTLTLRGTDGTTPLTSGNDVVVADFTKAGTAGNELVTVADAVNGALYNLQNVTNIDVIHFALGDGNDSITVNAGTRTLDIDAGRGNDTLTAAGSTTGVILRGGEGDDILTGGDGVDRLEGGDGNDTLTGGKGNDVMLGGAGSDTLIWNNGDNNDIMEGGEGTDVVVVNGSTTAGDTFVVGASGARVSFARTNLVPFTLDIAGAEQMNINSGVGADSITINDLTMTDLRSVRVDVGTGDGAVDLVTVNGTGLGDHISATLAGGVVKVAGLAAEVQISSAVSTDGLTINGNEGDDVLKANGITAIGVTLNGGAGNDELTSAGLGDAILLGGDGNDTLIGGAGNDTLNGEAGDDILYGAGGTNTIDGGTGFDIIQLLGTLAADTLTVTGPLGALVVTVNAVTGTNAVSNVEGLRVFGLDGNDTITLNTPIAATVDAGADDDTVVGTGSTAALVIDGGTGNDVLIGGTLADTIYGGDGNDRFGDPVAGDTAANDPGNDFYFGGAGFDRFVWDPGDGNDIINGGGDSADIAEYHGDGNANAITLSAAGGAPTHFNITLGGALVDYHGVETVIINALGGADTITVNDLFTTEVASVTINHGTADGAVDAVIINGTTGADVISITSPAAGAVLTTGLRYNVNQTNVELADTYRFNGNDGNDNIKAAVGVENVTAITLDGGVGDDSLSADATLLGGAGDDLLEGGAGNDTIDGGAGYDRLNASGDVNFVLSNTSLTGLGTDTLTSIEEVHLTGGPGANKFTVGAFTGTVAITGRSGSDTIDYSTSTAAVIVDIDLVGQDQLVSSTGAILRLGDVMENFIGSSFNDIIRADALPVPRSINGGPHAFFPPGDKLFFDGRGQSVAITHVDYNTGTIKTLGLADVAFDEVETISVSNAANGGGFGNPGGNSNAFLTASDADTFITPQGRTIGAPASVVTGDVNGDGFADIVTANSNSNTVSVFLGLGNGNFLPLVNFSSGGIHPTDLVLGDFNGDLKPDIAVTNRSTGNVGILIGNGLGGFGAATSIRVTPRPNSIAVGDLNGDGNADLAVTGKFVTANGTPIGLITVLLGNGTGGFGTVRTFRSGGPSPVDIVISDFNANGMPDILVADSSRLRVDLYAGNGTANPAAPVHFKVGAQPTGLAVADFNNDGTLDVAVSHSVSRFVSVLLGNGAVPGAQFRPHIRNSFPGLHATTGIVAADFNGDGNADLALSNRIGAQVSVMLGDSVGHFTRAFEFDLGNRPLRRSMAIAIADFNNDGGIDIVAANPGSDDISVLLRNTTI